MGLAALAAVATALAAPVVQPATATNGAAPAPRLQLVAHVRAPGGYAGDVYGHRGFAYLSSHKGAGPSCPAQGVRVYSLARPRRPVRVSAFGRVARTWTEKTIVKSVATPRFRGDLAVASFQACERGAFQGFGLYDVTHPRAPRELARVATDPRGSHEIWLQAVGSRAYVYTAIEFSEAITARNGAPGRPGFRIFDVTDPTAPREVGDWGAWRDLGIPPGDLSKFIDTNFVHSVITNTAATRAYVSYWDLGTVILDISDPTKPRYFGRTTFARGAAGNAHSAAIDPRERLLIETDETDNGKPRLFDISDKRAPRHLADFALPRSVVGAGHRAGMLAPVAGIDLTDSVHDAKLVGKRAVFSWYGQGVVLADVSNPSRPRFLARFLPRPERDAGALLCPGRRCTAVWGVYVDRGYVLASDMISGLWVLRIR